MSGLTRDRIEHKARKCLVQTLICRGPATARGLSEKTERSMRHVDHHLKVLVDSGIVQAKLGPGGAENREAAYTVKLKGRPAWVYRALLKGFSMQTCLQLMNHLNDAGSLGPRELAERTELSENDVARYLWYLDALGYVESSR